MHTRVAGGIFPRVSGPSRSRAPLRCSLLLLALVATACDRGNDSAGAAPPLAAPSLPGRVPLRPQAELAQAFVASSETIFEARTGEDLSKLVAQQQATLSVVPEGLRMTATGVDPILLLPPFVEGKQAILQIMITSPLETPMQLFYAERERPTMTEENSQTIVLKQGTNVVYFQLDQPGLIDPVRLDPAAAPGDYIIKSLVARGVINSPAP